MNSRRGFLKTLGGVGAVCAYPSLGVSAAYATPENNEADMTTSAFEDRIQPQAKSMKISIFSPSGVVLNRQSLDSAKTQLEQLGALVHVDESADKRFFGFAGSDEDRLDAIMRVAQDDCDIALAARGGYGLNRLLDRIDWQKIARSVADGKRWCGHSDFTAFQMGLLAHTGAPSWAAPMAVSDFSLIDAHGKRSPKLDPVTTSRFMAAMRDEVKSVQFQTQANFSGLDVKGLLWGGNVSMLSSLLGTGHFPKIAQGILFLEDINERPYRIERNLLQLHQAGAFDSQKVVILGDFGYWKPLPVDMGYKLSDVIDYIRSVTKTPILTGLPFGHISTKVTLPVGLQAQLIVDQHTAQIHW